MNEELKNKLKKVNVLLIKNLPEEIFGFGLKIICAVDNNKFIFFTYENKESHCALVAYFHEETLEFKIHKRIGLTEFCLTDFFSDTPEQFKNTIDAGIYNEVQKLKNIRNPKSNLFIDEKKITSWKFGMELPKNLENFELFINPQTPVEVTNGSFIIVNYASFLINSDLSLYYNIFSDEFSGETRVNGITNVLTIFDSTTLEKLEKELKEYLVKELQSIRYFSK